jgi:hypothetical protein
MQVLSAFPLTGESTGLARHSWDKKQALRDSGFLLSILSGGTWKGS